MKRNILITVSAVLMFCACNNGSAKVDAKTEYSNPIGCDKQENIEIEETTISNTSNKSIINEKGMTIETRFNPPNGFQRKSVDEDSFAYYLRNLPLKPAGAKVKYYNGNIKDNGVYDAVVDMDVSNRDLQQCADAIIRLRGEYFYSMGRLEDISFTLTNGFEMDYLTWREGNRVIVNGNNTVWRKTAEYSDNYANFRAYIEFVFIYAGTLSLSKSLHPKDIKDIDIGDVFILGGSPGHAVIVVDVAENENGKKVFLLAQSYMPAQETQILKNYNDNTMSPWYSADITEYLYTPEWTFKINQLKTW
ncbi:MAG: DUF4846 domain-containing protein [Bacteroidales bacterium]|nr:DUF4846 domain-containing protein [Bacteroidales bacterium]